MSAAITATNVLCSIGRGAPQVWACARAGIARIGSSHVMDRRFEPIQMGLVPEDALGDLSPEIDRLPLPLAHAECCGLQRPRCRAWAPRIRPTRAHVPWHAAAVIQGRALAQSFSPVSELLTNVPVDIERSVVAPHGRASALIALEYALAALAADPAGPVIVGGVDTHLDLRLLGELDAEQRILGPTVMDGFIPGEGAAFLALAPADSRGRKRAETSCSAAASVADPGHRYGSDPARGEGLSAALEKLRGRLASAAPVGVTFAGFNGESFDAKLWGVAQLRHRTSSRRPWRWNIRRTSTATLAPPPARFSLCLLLPHCRTAVAMGPAFVWAASDHEPRACALLSVSA